MITCRTLHVTSYINFLNRKCNKNPQYLPLIQTRLTNRTIQSSRKLGDNSPFNFRLAPLLLLHLAAHTDAGAKSRGEILSNYNVIYLYKHPRAGRQIFMIASSRKNALSLRVSLSLSLPSRKLSRLIKQALAAVYIPRRVAVARGRNNNLGNRGFGRATRGVFGIWRRCAI